MNRAVLPTFDTNKKNASGKKMYIKLSKDMTRYYNETIMGITSLMAIQTSTNF